METLKISDILDQSNLKRGTFAFHQDSEDFYCALGAIYKSISDSDFKNASIVRVLEY